MADAEKLAAADGPVRPISVASGAHRPLGGRGVQLTSGLLHGWQLRNRAASLPLALRQLETAGNLDNLRLAGSGASSGYRGPVFMDSDVYKTLEAISWELGRAPGSDLAEFAAESTALVAKAQQDDGYLNSCIQVTGRPRYTHLESSHELYCAGHLIQAAVAAARTFDGGALLSVARHFADHLVSTFLGGDGGLDGHPIVETALVELYRQTGTAAYLELASQFVDGRGRGLIGDSGFGNRYLQDSEPIRQHAALAGHAVRALYLESGVVDVATETGDAQLLASSVGRWNDMVATKTTLTGSNGSRHSGEAFGDAFELPPDRGYNETCAAIASFQWSWRLLLATGESKYADLMERVLYNGFGAAVSADGQRFFYVNPLQRRDDHFENDDPGRRREWFSCACCPPNIMRLIASLNHYVATTAEDVLFLHLLTPAQISTPLGQAHLSVDVTTDYPWDGQVRVGVRSAPVSECGLAVRIPAWSGEHSVRLNGNQIEPADNGTGYLLLRRRWQSGDVLEMSLDVRPRLTYPSRRIDALRGTVAVERGPLVYCFEQADQSADMSLEDLAVSPGPIAERATSIPGVGPTTLLEAGAVHLAPTDAEGLPYLPHPDPGPVDRPAVAVAVPYFQWDNRDGRAMRIWMPVRRTDSPATS
ncbi:MAG: glycoside hydrolase family 127 protein [Actinobacteria bacterium]|nr:glycoside hydrolase family 127 protein [Actinomycetota bacterium]